jgi:hypothetical protein
MGIALTFCPGWPWTAILPICTFWVAGISGMSHQTWTLVFSFIYIKFYKQFWSISCIFSITYGFIIIFYERIYF